MVRYLHPADHHQIRKICKDAARKLGLKDTKFPDKIRDIHKMRKRIVSALMFLVIKVGEISNLYILKNTFFKRRVYLLWIEDVVNSLYNVIKDIKRFLYYQTLHHDKNILVVIFYSTLVETVTFKNCDRKIKLPFMIYVDFEGILVPEENGK